MIKNKKYIKKPFTFAKKLYKIKKNEEKNVENKRKFKKEGVISMKILMLTWEYPPRVVGGISRVVYDLSRTLLKDGHDVTVVTYKDGDAPYFEDDKGVKVHRVDNFMINPNNFIDWIMQMNFNMIAKANEIIAKEGNFDVIHAHDWLVAYAAKTLKNSYNIPIVSTIHATEAGRNSGIHDETQRYINDTEWMLTYESSEVIVNSNYMKGELQRLFGLPYEKINVVPNGVNLSLFNGVERDYNFRRRYAMDNEKIILFMGRLVYEKGIQHLIAAMPKILSGYHDTKLVICGKGGMLEELQQQVRQMGIENKVYFAGYMQGKDVQKMYKAADISVFPSTYEPFGIVALEAMLSENPVVVSDIGGLNENKVRNDYNWSKIAQDTHFTYQKAICQSMAEKQKRELEQERARKTKKARNTEREITNLLSFRKRQAYA